MWRKKYFPVFGRNFYKLENGKPNQRRRKISQSKGKIRFWESISGWSLGPKTTEICISGTSGAQCH
jgi:hypothetical protein